MTKQPLTNPNTDERNFQDPVPSLATPDLLPTDDPPMATMHPDLAVVTGGPMESGFTQENFCPLPQPSRGRKTGSFGLSAAKDLAVSIGRNNPWATTIAVFGIGMGCGALVSYRVSAQRTKSGSDSPLKVVSDFAGRLKRRAAG
jgi:hypothetical protein